MEPDSILQNTNGDELAGVASGGLQLPEPFALVGMVMFSLLGMWAIKEGRREANIKQLLLGIVLVGYSYFTPEAWQVWLVGSGLTAAVFKCRD